MTEITISFLSECQELQDLLKNKVVLSMAKNSGNKIEGVKGQTIQIFQRNQLLKYDLMLKPALLALKLSRSSIHT